jgi:hypothetical protein
MAKGKPPPRKPTAREIATANRFLQPQRIPPPPPRPQQPKRDEPQLEV